MRRVMDKPSKLVSELVPAPMNQVLGEKPKASPVVRAKLGQGKTGRVNESELLMRLRHPPTVERTTDNDGTGIRGRAPATSALETPRPGVKAAPTPVASLSCETWKPQWSPTVVDTSVSQRQRRPNSPEGVGRPKKRKPAAERQRESITGWIGQYPT
jgi:hypothetical protein